VKAKHKVLLQNGLVPVYVFDGARHNMKKLTNSAREKEREKAQEELKALKATRCVQDRKDADELWKKITFPREDVLALIVQWFCSENISFFAAPFEAECQLVCFEQNKMISSIISEDGDCLILGAQTVVTIIDWKSGNCCIIRRDKILQRESAGKGKFNDFLPELSSLLGNDYISRLHCHSPKKVRDILEKYIECSDRDAFLQNIEEKSKWPMSIEKSFKSPATGFSALFKKETSLIRTSSYLFN
jgi:5'-3' exonuclease